MSNLQQPEPILLYDINTVPYGIELQQVVDIFKEHKVVLYDLHGYPKYCEPRIITTDKEVEFKTIDTKLLKPAEIRELIKGLEEVYKANQSETRLPSVYDKEFCNNNGKIVSKYVYYVRVILNISKDIPMSGQWLISFNEYVKDNVDFPLLTKEQIAQLDLESQANRV